MFVTENFARLIIENSAIPPRSGFVICKLLECYEAGRKLCSSTETDVQCTYVAIHVISALNLRYLLLENNKF